MRRLFLSATALLALVAAPAWCSDFSSLEERMSGDDFTAAGLERLSPDELARLNDWLRANWPRSADAATPYPAQADRRGLSDPSVSRDAIVSQLDGDFTGWSTGTTFRLENGMVWETTGSVTPLAVRGISRPNVIIEPAFLGTWLLRIEGYNATVRVKRIR